MQAPDSFPMSPNLTARQHAQSHDMIADGSLTALQMAAVLGCSTRSVQLHRANMRCFGSTTAPHNRKGRRSAITPTMLDTLLEFLGDRPGQDLDEMVLFLSDEFGILPSRSTISRALSAVGWSQKTTRCVAKGRNADLRDHYLHALSQLKSYQLVYVDESGLDKRIGFRRRGWSPRGITPAQVAQFQRGQRYQVLPAYSQDGVLLARVFQGNTDATMFLDFIEEVLTRCHPFPGKHSVLIMDNASFHRTDEIVQACSRAGVKLVFLPPYSPDLNPIEEFFAEFKAFVRKHFRVYQDNPDMAFEAFLEWSVDEVGARVSSAHGHFRHAGVSIEQL